MDNNEKVQEALKLIKEVFNDAFIMRCFFVDGEAYYVFASGDYDYTVTPNQVKESARYVAKCVCHSFVNLKFSRN